jgi:D-alanyl-D-alanine carboxypeptidase
LVNKSLFAAFCITCLLPAQAGRFSIDTEVRRIIKAPPQPVSVPALDTFNSRVQARGERIEDQGILIETLDGPETIASENADSLYNPASVMKLATSLAALAKFGPDYRYRTNVLADGNIDTRSRRLEGDLVIEGSADPMFTLADAQEISQQIARLGVARVTGALRIAGAFYYFATGYHCNLSRETSAGKLRTALQRSGITIEGPIEFGPATGKILLSHYSERLSRILLFQNAHSSNAVAEVVGESVGGPDAIQRFLIEDVGLRNEEIYVGRASGLEFNRITPRAALRVLRALIQDLAEHSLKPEDVMPVGGVDSGTLRSRFAQDGIRGSIIAKTGTLVSIDNGVSTLVGIAHTRSRGPLLFAIFNSEGGVRAYRRLQDQFLSEVVEGQGGGVQASRIEDALATGERDTFTQVVLKPSETSETSSPY